MNTNSQAAMMLRQYADDESYRFEIPEMGLTISVDRSTASDRAPVIFIDTDERLGEEGPLGPKIRVNVNDGEVFRGVERGEEPDESAA
jgi:hypothetical protein